MQSPCSEPKLRNMRTNNSVEMLIFTKRFRKKFFKKLFVKNLAIFALPCSTCKEAFKNLYTQINPRL